MYYLTIYILVINVLAIFLMRADKIKARKNMSRISEKRLLLIGFAFGSLGILIGMYLFRHKTKKIKFKIGIPIFFVSHCIFYYVYILSQK